MDSFIDDLSSIASKGLSHHDCGGPFHVDNTSGSMHQQHTPRQATTSGKAINTTREREKEREKEDRVKGGRKVEKKESRQERMKEERKKEGTLRKKSASRLRRT